MARVLPAPVAPTVATLPNALRKKVTFIPQWMCATLALARR